MSHALDITSIFSTTYRVALVANSTTKHNKAALGHAKLTQGSRTLKPALWRLGPSGGSFYYQELEVQL
jgi:hypothetical protein